MVLASTTAVYGCSGSAGIPSQKTTRSFLAEIMHAANMPLSGTRMRIRKRAVGL